MKRSIESWCYDVFCLLSLYINVLLYIPLLVYGILKKEKEKGNVLFFPLFLSIVSFGFQPPYEFDLYRHYETFDQFCKFSYEISFIKDLYLPFLNYIGCYFGFTHKFIYVVTVFIYYFIVCFIIKDFFSGHNNDHIYVKFFLCAFLILNNNLVEISGLRFPASLSFSILYLWRETKGKKDLIQYVLLALSILSHFSMIILVVMNLAFKLSGSLFSRYKSIVAVSLSLILGLLLVKPFVSLLLVTVQNKIGFYIGAETYTSGEWGAERIEIQGYNSTGAFVERFKLYYNVFVLWVIIVILALSASFNSKNITRLTVFTCVCFIFIPFDTIYFRYQNIPQILSVFIIYEHRNNLKKFTICLLIILIFSKLILQYLIGFLSSYSIYIKSIILEYEIFNYGIFMQLLG
ncbi:EpsG family protein [Grimontia hollisae]|uniref:EpsG family protein n=1 Tax=Grimontia hollisae TaxID=673 RepID=A0A377HLD7_GRIHO|nr:EpsG family protein [Grimontia hollisae]STO56904.1 Uncharacterised protein [Grimontia hollisae]